MLIDALSEALADHAERHPECDCEWPLVITQHFAPDARHREEKTVWRGNPRDLGVSEMEVLRNAAVTAEKDAQMWQARAIRLADTLEATCTALAKYAPTWNQDLRVLGDLIDSALRLAGRLP